MIEYFEVLAEKFSEKELAVVWSCRDSLAMIPRYADTIRVEDKNRTDVKLFIDS